MKFITLGRGGARQLDRFADAQQGHSQLRRKSIPTKPRETKHRPSKVSTRIKLSPTNGARLQSVAPGSWGQVVWLKLRDVLRVLLFLNNKKEPRGKVQVRPNR